MTKAGNRRRREWYARHREHVKKYQAEYYAKHKEQIAQRAKARMGWAKRNPHRVAFFNRRCGIKLKQEVLAHYGGCKCVICKESRLSCLSLDHIGGGGNKERKMGKLVGTKFYHWLKKNNYPDLPLRVLCMNCQFIERDEQLKHKYMDVHPIRLWQPISNTK